MNYSNNDQLMPKTYGTISLFGWKWDEIGQYFLISIFLLTATLVKIIYHKNRKVLHNIPESCSLILLGIAVGVLIVSSDFSKAHIPEFTPSLFNFILLPPIVLDSSYELHHHSFFGNIGTIIMFAAVGTIMNVILVTLFLYVSQMMKFFGKLTLPAVEIFMFSVIVSAVDPVAVLSVFQEVNVNKALYFLVFGESLLNDAVVITLYESVKQFAAAEYIQAKDVLLGFLSFISSTVGGLAIGMFWGIITCLMTKTTNDRKLRVVEPLIVLTLAYLAYITGDLFKFSAILSLMACGLVQAEYATLNISRKSETTIKYWTKITSSAAETIIFLFLGLVLVNTHYKWNTSFTVFSTFYCVLARFITVFLLTYIANVYFQRIRIVNFEEQVLMAYGGLRGAIAFSLANILGHPSSDSNEVTIKHHQLITTTTLFIILFTVFVLGSTTKPIVKMLRVQIQTKGGGKHFMEFNNRVVRVVMQGIEVLAGQQNDVYWAKKIVYINEQYLKRFLLQNSDDRDDIPDYDPTATMVRNVFQSFDPQQLDTPEKDLYPDLNLRITLHDAFDKKGNMLFPKLNIGLNDSEADDVKVIDVTRVFIIPKECCSLMPEWPSIHEDDKKSKNEDKDRDNVADRDRNELRRMRSQENIHIKLHKEASIMKRG